MIAVVLVFCGKRHVRAKAGRPFPSNSRVESTPAVALLYRTSIICRYTYTHMFEVDMLMYGHVFRFTSPNYGGLSVELFGRILHCESFVRFIAAPLRISWLSLPNIS